MPERGMPEPRRRRSNGQASRERILDAAAEIAGERGYEGTSINLISERSGLPASSIYWHFKDKDELVAAVIDRSFHQWLAASDAPLPVPDGATPDDVFHLAMRRIGGAIAEFPDFLRLGLMLVLERRPEELTARRKFLEVRHDAAERTRALYHVVFPDLDDADVDALVTLSLGLSDGLFIAQDAGEVELASAFDLVATAIVATVGELRRAKRPAPAPKRRRAQRATRRSER